MVSQVLRQARLVQFTARPAKLSLNRGFDPGSGTFSHKLPVTDKRMNTELKSLRREKQDFYAYDP